MSVIFLEGFDFYNTIGPGGRKWDQGSGGFPAQRGRWPESYSLAPGTSGNLFIGSWPGSFKTFPDNYAGWILGMACRFDTFTADYSVIKHPIVMFADYTTIQCSVWLDPNTLTLTLRTGRGQDVLDTTLCDTGFVPPLNLWFYLEVKVTIGSPGSVEFRINSETVASAGGIQTQQSGNPTMNRLHLTGMGEFGPSYLVDDLYLLDPNDGTGFTDYLGELHVMTHYPDADGSTTSFLRSQGNYNYLNANTTPTSYGENGKYNYSGIVNARELYAITPFQITGTIFAVQENVSFRKDDVGNRSIAPLMRTASTDFLGSSYACYSSYTHAGRLWEYNPDTTMPWDVIDLNNTEFGLKVTA